MWRCVGDEGNGWGSRVGRVILFRKCGAGSAGATPACAAPWRAALLNRAGARPALLADVRRQIEGRGGYLCCAATAGATKKGYFLLNFAKRVNFVKFHSLQPHAHLLVAHLQCRADELTTLLLTKL